MFDYDDDLLEDSLLERPNHNRKRGRRSLKERRNPYTSKRRSGKGYARTPRRSRGRQAQIIVVREQAPPRVVTKKEVHIIKEQPAPQPQPTTVIRKTVIHQTEAPQPQPQPEPVRYYEDEDDDYDTYEEPAQPPATSVSRTTTTTTTKSATYDPKEKKIVATVSTRTESGGDGKPKVVREEKEIREYRLGLHEILNDDSNAAVAEDSDQIN
eukprot:TRINITY_DN793_c0_g1_i3.p1 TRINITY_DN793_c0_g1~~TRINITY_DN793_c0_g1_i3.p1  ORF type:complete len:211 (-),score=70.04 TRINITY_DN793_c0_g1_i3:281-913(-)